MPDIFDTIAARDAAPVKPATRLRKMWRIAYGGTATRDSKLSTRLYPHALARKIVARLKRRGVPAYAAPMMVRS